MGCLALLGIIGLLFFGVRLAPGDVGVAVPVRPLVATVEPPQMMTPTPTPFLTILLTSTFSAEGATPMDLLTAASTIQSRIAMLDLEEDVHVIVSENADEPRLIIQSPHIGDLLDLLIAPGYLELVDLSGLDAATLFEMEGTTLWTTGQARAFGETAPDGAQLHPETGEPFETVVDGFLVLRAEATLNTNVGQWIVQIGFDGSGALRLEEFTAAHIGDPMGIVVDGKVISVPYINSEIPGGEVFISGNFTEREARQLAVQFGTVPLRIRLVPLDVS
jgi:preprotein translocase subunit SecD